MKAWIKTFLCFLLLSAALAGCGKKGPPKPIESDPPAQSSDGG